MPRGIRLFAWLFIIAACVHLLLVVSPAGEPGSAIEKGLNSGHAAMGLSFGMLQLAYGVYLYFTEKSRNET
jgi:hypothetical protein